MSYKVHFIKEDGKSSTHHDKSNHHNSEKKSSWSWLDSAKKEILIRYLTKHKWTSKNTAELQKYDVERLRDKMYHCLKEYGTIQDRQSLEECVMKDKSQREENRTDKLEKNRKRKETILGIGVKYFILGAKVWLFDEKPTDKYGRIIRKLDPIQVKVTEVKNEGKLITVEFQETRQWYEAGGHWVQKGQTMNFKFDPVTCTWLREGLTPEVVRSIGANGKSKYFELSYTRQYLLLPMG
jgi:hypothetical protein